jgi:CRISPR-associated endonuclease Csn1
MTFAPVNEANVDARNNDKEDSFAYTTKIAGSLKTAQGRSINISSIGELRDPSFQG